MSAFEGSAWQEARERERAEEHAREKALREREARPRVTMPVQASSTSRQDYETPPDFLAAVTRRFGELDVDLACGLSDQLGLFGKSDTRKAPHGLCWPAVDSLTVPWGDMFDGCTMWLNPPFKRMDPWVAKCKLEAAKLEVGRILVLSPACVATNWFERHVWGVARVFPLLPRITFVGEVHPFPKDLMLSVYGPGVVPGVELWRWKGRGAT